MSRGSVPVQRGSGAWLTTTSHAGRRCGQARQPEALQAPGRFALRRCHRASTAPVAARTQRARRRHGRLEPSAGRATFGHHRRSTVRRCKLMPKRRLTRRASSAPSPRVIGLRLAHELDHLYRRLERALAASLAFGQARQAPCLEGTAQNVEGLAGHTEGSARDRPRSSRLGGRPQHLVADLEAVLGVEELWASPRTARPSLCRAMR